MFIPVTPEKMSTIRQNTGSEYGPQMYADEWRQRRWIFRRRWSNVLFMLLIHRHTPEINWFSFIHFIITQSHTVRSQTPVVYTVIKHRPQPERCSAENCGMELYSPNRNYSRKTKKNFFLILFMWGGASAVGLLCVQTAAVRRLLSICQ